MKRLFRTVLYVFVIFLFLSYLIDTLRSINSSRNDCMDRMMLSNEGKTLHERQWISTEKRSSFCTSYESSDSISSFEGQKRNDISSNVRNYERYWGSVYQELVLESKYQLDFLLDSLLEISMEEQLNRMEFAAMVVSFVQDIPYSYVRPEPCSNYDNQDKPCVGNIALGLLSPYEFLHTEYGDCDTRAVLIYALLEQANFDPMIVISNEYAHAMLALNIPAVGDHLKYLGRNYYFWETTGKGWPIGMLPPNSNNVNYWKVALVNNN